MRLFKSRKGLLCAVVFLPLVAVHGSLVISILQGYVEPVMPYLDGGSSISATGRHGIAYVYFKALMLPQAVLLFLFWRHVGSELSGAAARFVVRSGSIGAVFLVLYVVFLGSEGDVYRWLRRYGVFVFFLGTWGAQIATTWIRTRRGIGRHSTIAWQRRTLVLMLALALAEAPLGTFGMADSQAENIIEWWFSLLLQIWFFLEYRLERPGIDPSSSHRFET